MNTLKIIGIAVETTNKDGKSAQDIGQLWGRFYVEVIVNKIPNKVSNDVYSIYTNYESDYTGKYTTIIGLSVSSLDDIPTELIGREFKPLNFKKYTAKGAMPNAVVDTWKEIWENNSILNRSYSYDFELYGEKCNNGDESEVEIFIGIKE